MTSFPCALRGRATPGKLRLDLLLAEGDSGKQCVVAAVAGMDYTLEGQFTPGKVGAWRFDKRSYASRPPPRKLGEPPKGMTNELVRPRPYT